MYRTVLIAVLIGGFTSAGAAWAQELDNGNGDGDGIGPWHAAVAFAERDEGAPPAPTDVLRAAEAEVILGRPERALSMLSRHTLPDSMSHGAPLAVFAAAQYLLGDYRAAGRLFGQSAQHAVRLRRAVLDARAAASYEKAGLLTQAAAHYRQAGVSFPAASGWLALREAAVTHETAAALSLLQSGPPAAQELSGQVRSSLLAAAGDTAGAVEALASVGRFAEAGRLALASGELQRGRQLIYRAVTRRDREQVLSGVEIALSDTPPANAKEHLAIGRALYRHGPARDALRHVSAAVAAGDSSAATLLFFGDVTEARRNRWGAIRIYDLLVGTDADEAAEAEYRRARAFVRLRRRTSAYAALRDFLQHYPDHVRSPAALFLMGDLRQTQGRLTESDSLYRELTERWERNEFSSRARLRLASRALRRRDTAGAIELYRAEVEARGPKAGAAQFLTARLALSKGDSATAYQEWADLARRDSIGYYGTAAREAAGLPELVFEALPPPSPSPEVTQQLAVLDLLTAAGLEREAAALLAHVSDTSFWDVSQLTDVAEGLVARGRAREAVRVGWRIAGLHHLNDPRVLRLIFPFPNRALVEREAEKFDLDPYLMAALIRQESAFDADATSRAGARGMMQLMPATARWLAGRLGVDWDNAFLGIADANVHLGAAHLADQLRRYNGEVVPALAAYNAGGSRANRWLRFPEAGDWFAFIERIPFAETRGYVQTLLRNRAVYRALYGAAAGP